MGACEAQAVEPYVRAIGSCTLFVFASAFMWSVWQCLFGFSSSFELAVQLPKIYRHSEVCKILTLKMSRMYVPIIFCFPVWRDFYFFLNIYACYSVYELCLLKWIRYYAHKRRALMLSQNNFVSKRNVWCTGNIKNTGRNRKIGN